MKKLLLATALLAASTLISAQGIVSSSQKSVCYKTEDVCVKRISDARKGDISAAKLTYHPNLNQWVRQVILYNKFPNNISLEKQLKYVLNLTLPKKPGSKAWASYKFKSFK